jgi:hypothetical protein
MHRQKNFRSLALASISIGGWFSFLASDRMQRIDY